MSWAEDKFDATRSEDDGPADDGWTCHECSDGGPTPWNPGETCPRYPCRAHKRSTCCRIHDCTCLKWVL